MKNPSPIKQGIPVSVSLEPTLEVENFRRKKIRDKKRLIYLSALAVALAAFTSLAAKALIYLIALFTNLFFYGRFAFTESNPADNTLGYWVILVPAGGGLLVGLIALYGSKAIRGHGIPEAMEQVLTNESRIRPAMTYLKPLSAALSIGTGGPFGAEGPIIATGGALGSTAGQWLRTTARERKILLAAGATAGMSAIFGSPLAAVFLAIELLLFEFSPRSILPVALACITGAAGHHFLFEEGPVFPIATEVQMPSNFALFIYSIFGIATGVAAVLTTKLLYLIEDLFERLPLHWMWWPALGGLIVGIVGVAEPRTLGVGYENISELLQGGSLLSFVIWLGVLKFVSWIIALGSGTSGGTLAPLLTIGACLGIALFHLSAEMLPDSSVTASLSAIVGMAAMFAGSSRALLTSIVFALEVTHQTNALLPLLAGCTGSYLVSFFLMENTIMTEKIARRGVRTPDSYVPDVLGKLQLHQVAKWEVNTVRDTWTVKEAKAELRQKRIEENTHYLVIDAHGTFIGIGEMKSLLNFAGEEQTTVMALPTMLHAPVSGTTTLKSALRHIQPGSKEALAVYDLQKQHVGLVTYWDLLLILKSSVTGGGISDKDPD